MKSLSINNSNNLKLTIPPLDITEKTGFSEEIDIFNRKPHGEALLNLIQNTDDELVIALDAPWGEGKTTFIKMWQGLLYDKKIPYIYFDAFINDFQSDPFLAISSQLYTLLDKSDDEKQKQFKRKATAALKVVGRAGLRIGIKTLTAGLLDENITIKGLNTDDLTDEASALVDDYIAKRLEEAKKDREALEEFKIYLTELGEKLGDENHLIFIIDELDRCKPKFALSLLEVIKHLFSVPKITFLLVINREQLEESVKFEYGSGVNASRYLQKFISIWTTLSKVTGKSNSIHEIYLYNCLIKMGYNINSQTRKDTYRIFKKLVNHYTLSLREIEKCLTNYAIIHNASDGNLNFKYSQIAVLSSILKVIKPELYKSLKIGSISHDAFLKKASLKSLKVKWAYSEKEDHPFFKLVKYVLGTEDEIKNIAQDDLTYRFRLEDRDIFKNVTEWLDLFQRE